MSALTDITNIVLRSPAFVHASTQPAVSGLQEGLKSLFISYLASRNHAIAVITHSPDELTEDILCWCKNNPKFNALKIYNLSDEFALQSAIPALLNTPPMSIFVTAPRKDLPSPDTLRQSLINCNLDKFPDINGKSLSMMEFSNKLAEFGFTFVDTVNNPTEFVKRGGIIDLWPGGTIYPVRLEFTGDAVTSIREFDPLRQVSISKLQKLIISPLNISGENNEHSQTDGQTLRSAPTKQIIPFNRGIKVPTYSNTGGRPPLQNEKERVAIREDKTKTSSVNIMQYFKSPDVIIVFDGISGNKESVPNKTVYIGDGFSVGSQSTYNGNFDIFKDTLESLKSYTKFVLCETESETKHIASLFPELEVRISNLPNGFILPDAKLAVFTYMDIFGRKRKKREYHPFKDKGVAIQDLESLQKGDFIVHIDYGIGIYQGITKLKFDTIETDCLFITYKNGDLYVPIDKFNCIERWVGDTAVSPELTDLGSKSWEQRKNRAKKAIHELTTELIALYAERKISKGHKFAPDNLWQSELESGFPYEETLDQLKAIVSIKQDMESDLTMDRLVCGEVGYGKTELALRAAFKAVMDNKQVAILCPTTILVEQHYRTFKTRMSPFPVNIAQISRFQTTKQQEKAIADIHSGNVDILIGTHKLLGETIQFKDLGLLIIDEEHRFGVSQKEKLKKLKKNVDILSLTATPIPRTLYMALTNIKNLSRLETAPAGRQPIITRVASFDRALIKNAIESEISRGGQVYFVHNRISSIYSIANFIQKLSPDFKIGIAHSEIPSKELELIMLRFFEKDINVLVSTAIIGSGIDIPSTNTIIINRADRFGLADLHQLRGRVGRSQEHACCWLLVPENITPDAKRRLQAISTYSELGAGFKLALQDLEFRGAGNLLGGEQHGHIYSIGYKLYEKLLEEEINNIYSKTQPDKAMPLKKLEPEIRMNVNCFIPEDYAPYNQKFLLYKKIANITSFKEITAFENELADRFGPIPSEVKNLLECTHIKLLAIEKGISNITSKKSTQHVGKREITLRFLTSPSQKFLSNSYVKEVKSIDNSMEVLLAGVRDLQQLITLLSSN
ncbi:MAG: transcription-repair coupling factor [bacterium]|nr:transcription-repair coupling factor [bacterium]